MCLFVSDLLVYLRYSVCWVLIVLLISICSILCLLCGLLVALLFKLFVDLVIALLLV